VVGDGHQIGIECSRLFRARQLAGQHAQDVGRLRKGAVGRYRVVASLQTEDRRQEDGRRSQQSKGGLEILAILQASDESPHDFHRRQSQQLRIERRHVPEQALPHFAQPPVEIC